MYQNLKNNRLYISFFLQKRQESYENILSKTGVVYQMIRSTQVKGMYTVLKTTWKPFVSDKRNGIKIYKINRFIKVCKKPKKIPHRERIFSGFSVNRVRASLYHLI